MGLDGAMMSWTAVIPVKRLGSAKSRLGGADDPRRPDLALAFALDVISACQSSPSISSVIVVTDDPDVIASAPAVIICAEPAGGGLNRAILAGAALAHGPVVALAGDLPCLTPSSLEHVLRLAHSHERSLLSDTQGSGTAMLLSHDAAALDPHFGVTSRSAHVERGYVDLALDAPAGIRTLLAGARRDVDTPADLWDAVRIGVGASTAEVLGRKS
jgi:2-phospho-L-lactate/phosphoenolpyruvate guanylyltransferase